LQNSAAVQAQAEHVLARAEARLTSVQTILAGMVLVVIVLVAKASAPVLALGLLAAMAGLEAWAGLASHDARAGEVLAAEHRLSAIGAAPAKTSAPVTENPVLTICGQVLAPGSRLAIAGPSGVGKTRLMETLAGLRSDAPQRLMVDGMDPRELGLTHLRQIFALMPQDAP
jgi:ATP-binding cassette subfamily C protein CydC